MIRFKSPYLFAAAVTVAFALLLLAAALALTSTTAGCLSAFGRGWVLVGAVGLWAMNRRSPLGPHEWREVVVLVAVLIVIGLGPFLPALDWFEGREAD